MNMLINPWLVVLVLMISASCTTISNAEESLKPDLKPTPEQKAPEGNPLVPNVPPVNPQNPAPNNIIQKWPTLVDCGPTQVILALVKGKYGEIEFLMSNGMVQIPDGRVLNAPTLIYMNPQTSSYTIIAHFPNAISCILTSGKDIQPAPKVPNGQNNKGPQGPGLKPGLPQNYNGPYLEAKPLDIEVSDKSLLALQ